MYKPGIVRARSLLCYGAVVFALFILLLPAVGEAGPKVGDKFGRWTFTCKAYGPGETKCALVQEVRLKKGGRSGKRLLLATMGYIGSSNVLALAVRTPLNAYLPTGVVISVDSGRQRTIPFRQCKTDGCASVVKITRQFRDELTKGKKLHVRFKLILKKGLLKVPASVSLHGISRGFSALDGVTPPPGGKNKQDKDWSQIF
jgi:invasion protein IalB